MGIKGCDIYMEEARYLKETYIDEYHTLTQSILIDLVMDKESNGNHSRSLRLTVNPNLYLYKTEYLDINMEVIEKWKKQNKV